MKAKIYQITILFLFLLICDTKSFGSELSPEVLTAIRENQKTIDSVKTFHATTERTDHIKRKQGNRTLYVVQEVWYDGNHYRVDVNNSKFIGKDTTNLVLEKYPDGRIRMFAPPPISSLEIRSKESQLNFNRGRWVYIRPYKWDKENIVSQCPILRYNMFRFISLQEQVLRNVQQGYIFTAQPDSLNGEKCILLSCNYPDEDSAVKVWVVPAKGYCIKKRQSMRGGKFTFEYETTLREYSPGFWWFDSVIQKRWKQQEKAPFESIELSIEKITFNKPLDPKVFTIAGTDIPLGTKVRDKISGRDYVYGISKMTPKQTPTSLMDKPLPELKDVGIDMSPSDANDKVILVYFFDMEQRPSRNSLRQLSKRAQELKAKDVVVVAVQASKIDEKKLNEWVKKNNIPFPVGMIEGDEEKIRFTWGVRSLPWLILTDKKHIVHAEGFTLSELSEKLKQMEGK